MDMDTTKPEALLVAEVELELAEEADDEEAWAAAYGRYVSAMADVRLMQQGIEFP